MLVIGLASLVLGVLPGIPLATTVSIFFLGLFAPGLVYIIMLLIWVCATTKITDQGDSQHNQYYAKARYKMWPKIKGTDGETYALPLLKEIFECSRDSETHKHCNYCRDRLQLIERLVPSKISSDLNLDEARKYLGRLEIQEEERKKLLA